MQTMNMLTGIEFSQQHPEAQPIYISRTGRILRWNLRPGQSIKEHAVPDSPFYVIVLQGTGMFAGADGQEYPIGADSLVVFAPGEKHSIRALDRNLVFVGFMEGASSNTSDQVGGMMGHSQPAPE